MTDLDQLLATRRRAWYVDETMATPKGFIPAMVFEDDPGFFPAVGKEGGEPYYWGQTIEEAKRACDSANESLGLTPDEARDIVTSSIIAQTRQDAGRERASERMDRLRRGLPT